MDDSRQAASNRDARYAVEFTLYIGQQTLEIDPDLTSILASSAFGKGGHTMIAGRAGRDDEGAAESSAIVSKSYYVNDSMEAEEAAQQVREFLRRVFGELSQRSVLLRMDTVDRQERRIVVTDNRLMERDNVGVLTGSFLLPADGESP